MITYLELGIIAGVSGSLVSPWPCLSWPWTRGYFRRHILHRRGILPFVGVHQQSKLTCAHNPHAFQESPVHDEKIGVWVGMSRRRIIGPIFCSDTLNSNGTVTIFCIPSLRNLKKMKLTRPMLPSFSPRDDRCVASRFFSVNMKVSSQGNLGGRSLKFALATTTVWQSTTRLVLSFVYLLVVVYYRITAFRIL
jgi:hypothetical protein